MASHISPSKMETKASSSTAQDFIDYGDVCRICGSDENSLNLIGIYSNEGLGDDLPTKINTYLPVTVASTDDLPLQCCTKCVSTLNSWHVFVNNSVEADSKWKNFHVLASSSNKLLNEEEGDDGIGDRDDDQSELDDDMPLSELVETKQEPEDDDDLLVDVAPKKLKIEQTKQHKYKCTKCYFGAKTIKQLLLHIKTSHNPGKTVQDNETKHLKPSDCKVCDFKAKRHDILQRHMKDKHDNLPFVCLVCCLNFSDKETLLQHIDDIHSKKVLCPACPILVTPRCLPDHLKLHNTVDGKVTCGKCEKTFTTIKALDIHLSHLHDENQKFTCELCSEEIVTRANYNNHLKIHYVCNVCGKSGMSPKEYTFHMEMMHLDKSYQCDQCGKSYKTMHLLRIHMQCNHDKSRKYECVECNKIFGGKHPYIYIRMILLKVTRKLQ